MIIFKQLRRINAQNFAAAYFFNSLLKAALRFLSAK